MLPYFVIVAAVVYFVLKGTGILDEFARSQRAQGDADDQPGRRFIDRMRNDADMNRRLEVFKDFLGDNNEDEDG